MMDFTGVQKQTDLFPDLFHHWVLVMNLLKFNGVMSLQELFVLFDYKCGYKFIHFLIIVLCFKKVIERCHFTFEMPC
jgi:hypothetical protein